MKFLSNWSKYDLPQGRTVLMMYVAFSMALSLGLSYYFYQVNLESFRSQTSHQKTTTIRLVNSFVTYYSGIRSKLGSDAPVPATFRAHAMESFNKNTDPGHTLRLRMVGREGRSIATAPSDRELSQLIEQVATAPQPAAKTLMTIQKADGSYSFRSVYPSIASKQSCVSCHNDIQSSATPWKLNDVMGAFVIDVPISPFLNSNLLKSIGLGTFLFSVLFIIGVASFRENTARVLESQNVQFTTALDNMNEALAMYNADRELVVCNQNYANWYKLPQSLTKAGTPLSAIIEYRIEHGVYATHHNDKMTASERQLVSEQLTEKISNRTIELSDGRFIRITRQPMVGGGWVAMHRDITEQRNSQAQIIHMAEHDALTNLPNRLLFGKRLEYALAHVAPGYIVAVHFLDLDHFKNVNDTLGHLAGDKLLKSVSLRLQKQMREGDTIARMGGDEFAIVQTVKNPTDDCESLAKRIIAEVSRPYMIDGQQVIIGTSIGTVIASSDESDTETLLRSADLALYRAKNAGRGRHAFFHPKLESELNARRNLQNDLHKAIGNDEFELYFQPAVKVDTETISGFEALLRWHHPTKGLILPSDFVPLAEESGLIIAIGEWAIHRACQTAVGWPHPFRVAVNLSAVQFRSPNLVSIIREALETYQLPPDRLEIEVTESILISNTEAASNILHQLHEIGVRIAMDDFGTGYSSLSYLQTFPFDKIKIDKTFVQNLNDDGTSRSIIQAVVTMAKGMGVTTTAEGVETQEQLDLIRAEGCSEVQGYFFGRPMSHRIIEAKFFSTEQQGNVGGELEDTENDPEEIIAA